jgi:hypothetical protein
LGFSTRINGRSVNIQAHLLHLRHPRGDLQIGNYHLDPMRTPRRATTSSALRKRARHGSGHNSVSARAFAASSSGVEPVAGLRADHGI